MDRLPGVLPGEATWPPSAKVDGVVSQQRPVTRHHVLCEPPIPGATESAVSHAAGLGIARLNSALNQLRRQTLVDQEA